MPWFGAETAWERLRESSETFLSFLRSAGFTHHDGRQRSQVFSKKRQQKRAKIAATDLEGLLEEPRREQSRAKSQWNRKAEPF